MSTQVFTVSAGQEATLTYGSRFVTVTCKTGSFAAVVRTRFLSAPEVTVTPVGPDYASGTVVTDETPKGYEVTITDQRQMPRLYPCGHVTCGASCTRNQAWRTR